VTGGGANKDWSYKTSATTLAAPALDPGNIVVTGGNDDAVHAMSASNGQRNYQPGGTFGLTGGAIQGRASLIAAGDTSNPTCKNVCPVAYVAAGDGNVYAFRADTGALLWQTAAPLTTGAGSGFQAAAAVQVKSFANAGYTNAFDLVIVATRNAGSTTNNEVFGLNGNTGATVWTFNPGNMDIVNGTPYIDYVNNFVWVASRSAGGTGQPSLWKISTNSSGAAVANATFPLNDVDQPPTQNFDGKVIYVLANNGRLWVVRTDINNCSVRSGSLGTPVGFPVPIETAAVNDDVFFATTTGVSKVHVAYNAATCAAPTFTVSPGGWVNPVITNPSSLIFTSFPQVESMYVGSSDGHLYRINATTGANSANRVINLGATIGDPSFDTVLQKFYVGDTSGRIYSFDLF